MPFYDLQCADCNKEFNIRASMAERENGLIKCPDCGGSHLETIFKSIGVLRIRSKSSSEKAEAAMCPHMDKCGSCPHSH